MIIAVLVQCRQLLLFYGLRVSREAHQEMTRFIFPNNYTLGFCLVARKHIKSKCYWLNQEIAQQAEIFFQLFPSLLIIFILTYCISTIIDSFSCIYCNENGHISFYVSKPRSSTFYSHVLFPRGRLGKEGNILFMQLSPLRQVNKRGLCQN